MKYYIISESTELDEIGFYPQTSVETGFNINEEKTNFNKNLIKKGYIEIRYKAKKTNMIDKGSIHKGLVIDYKFKKLLSEHSLPSHKFYKIPTTHREKEFDYYWLNLINSNRHIDFRNSRFKIYDTQDNELGELKLTSEDFYNQINLGLNFEYRGTISKLVLKESFQQNDLMYFERIGLPNVIFISEKLKKDIEDKNMTGVRISEEQNIYTNI